jgi:hypothetical protein
MTNSMGPDSGRPIVDHPAIRRDRILTLLPRLLREQGTDAWLTFTRENTQDPILAIFGIEHIDARGAFVFAHRGGDFRRIAIAAPEGDDRRPRARIDRDQRIARRHDRRRADGGASRLPR